MKYWLKKCPHCRQGDLLEHMDMYGVSVECLQCGYVLSDEEKVLLFRLAAPQVDRERAAA